MARRSGEGLRKASKEIEMQNLSSHTAFAFLSQASPVTPPGVTGRTPPAQACLIAMASHVARTIDRIRRSTPTKFYPGAPRGSPWSAKVGGLRGGLCISKKFRTEPNAQPVRASLGHSGAALQSRGRSC